MSFVFVSVSLVSLNPESKTEVDLQLHAERGADDLLPILSLPLISLPYMPKRDLITVSLGNKTDDR